MLEVDMNLYIETLYKNYLDAKIGNQQQGL